MNIKKLNGATKKDPYPLPFTDEIINIIIQQEDFTFLNGLFGYHHISITFEY